MKDEFKANYYTRKHVKMRKIKEISAVAHATNSFFVEMVFNEKINEKEGKEII